MCEAAGRTALEQDTPPEEILDSLGAADLPEDTTGTADARLVERGFHAGEPCVG